MELCTVFHQHYSLLGQSITCAVAYQQILGSLTRIAVYAVPDIFMKLSIFAFFKSQWEFPCYTNFPLFSTKTHSLTLFQEIPYHLSAAGA